MTYITSHFSRNKSECVTYKVTVSLEEMKEINRKELKYYYAKGEINMYQQKLKNRRNQKMTLKYVIEVLILANAMSKDLKNEEKNK